VYWDSRLGARVSQSPDREYVEDVYLAGKHVLAWSELYRILFANSVRLYGSVIVFWEP